MTWKFINRIACVYTGCLLVRALSLSSAFGLNNLEMLVETLFFI